MRLLRCQHHCYELSLKNLKYTKCFLDGQLYRSLYFSEQRREERRGKASTSNQTHCSWLPLPGVGVLHGAVAPASTGSTRTCGRHSCASLKAMPWEEIPPGVLPMKAHSIDSKIIFFSFD